MNGFEELCLTSMGVFWIKASFKTHRSVPTLKTMLIPASLIWSSFLQLSPSLLLIHAFPKHVVSSKKRREKGERLKREKKREAGGGKKRKRKGLIIQFNYQPWLVSALVGNYTSQLQETGLLHPIRVGTQGYGAACFHSLCPTNLHSSLVPIFHFFS